MSREGRGEPDLAPGPARDLVDLFTRLRRTNSLTLGQVSAKTGLSVSYISEVLHGWKAPRAEAAEKIARALGADGDTILKARCLAEDLAALNKHMRSKERSVKPDPAAATVELPASPHTQVPAPGPPGATAQPRITGRRVVVSGVLAIATAAIAISAPIVYLTGNGSSLVTGSVTCQSGRPVVGIWIAALNGQSDSGYAHLGPVRKGINFASGPAVTYSYLLLHGGSYAVHVGCGGTASHWASRNFSPPLSAPVADLRCADPRSTGAGAVPTGNCVRTSVLRSSAAAPARGGVPQR